MSITVEVLGKAQVKKDGKQVLFPYRKAEGLFYYLIVNQTITRDEAIGIFWTDCSEENARKNLRDALYHLKKCLGKDAVLINGKNSIGLDMDRISHVDYAGLSDAQLIRHEYGTFLDYFYIKDCPLFEDWVAEIRNRLSDRFLDAARTGIQKCMKNNETEAVCTIGNLIISYKIFDDELIKTILQYLMEAGYPAKAKKIFVRYKEMLAAEYEDEPDEELEDIILRNKALKISRPAEAGKSKLPYSFFYRDREITEINETLKNYLSGSPYTSLLITGEAGVGKTAILNKVSSGIDTDTFVTLKYQCVQSEMDLYLRPWHDILAQLRILIQKFEDTENLNLTSLADSANIRIFATQYEQYAKNLFTVLCSHLGKERKIMLIIDDIQWMDYASMRLLSNILIWGKDHRIMAVLGARDTFTPENLKIRNSLLERDLLHEIPLERFSYAETSEIIRTYYPELGKDKGSVDKIFANTAGNALFLLELLKDYDPQKPLDSLTKKTVIMVQNRLFDLSREERNLLCIISLFPRFATLRDLQVLDRRPLESILLDIEHLLSCQLICFNNTYFNNGYTFSHQLIRQYVYSRLLPDRRAMMHAAVAAEYEREFLETHDSRLYPTLIHHFTGADNLYKAYNYQLEYFCTIYTIQNEIYPSTLSVDSFSASRPLPLTSSDALITLAKKVRALRVPHADELKMKLEFLIGRYDLYSGSFEHGLKNIQNSIAIAKQRNDTEYLLKNYLQMIFHAIQINNLRMFNDYLKQCEALIAKSPYPDATVYTIRRLRGLYLLKNYRYEDAERIFRDIIAKLSEADEKNSSAHIARAACSNYIGECKLMTGHEDAALEYFLKAIEYTKDEPDFSGLAIFYFNVGKLYYHQNDYARSGHFIDAALNCAEKTDALWGKARINCYKALLEMTQKNWEKAKFYYKKAMDFAEIGKNPVTLSLLNEVHSKFNTISE